MGLLKIEGFGTNGGTVVVDSVDYIQPENRVDEVLVEDATEEKELLVEIGE
jgi:hypothetical protein